MSAEQTPTLPDLIPAGMHARTRELARDLVLACVRDLCMVWSAHYPGHGPELDAHIADEAAARERVREAVRMLDQLEAGQR